jgi:hypothetical protein
MQWCSFVFVKEQLGFTKLWYYHYQMNLLSTTEGRFCSMELWNTIRVTFYLKTVILSLYSHSKI